MPDWKAGTPDVRAGMIDDPRLVLIFGNRRGYLEPGPKTMIQQKTVQARDWPAVVNHVL